MLTGNKIPFVDENVDMKKALKILSKKSLGVLIVQNKKKLTKRRHYRWTDQKI